MLREAWTRLLDLCESVKSVDQFLTRKANTDDPQIAQMSTDLNVIAGSVLKVQQKEEVMVSSWE
jgi:hypothetical protein